jgi:2-isopropylmalate synthase
VVRGKGNGPIDAFVNGLSEVTGEEVRVLGYHEHSVSSGANAHAIAYVELRVREQTHFGVGKDANIVTASLNAIVSGLQRAGVHLEAARDRARA